MLSRGQRSQYWIELREDVICCGFLVMTRPAGTAWKRPSLGFVFSVNLVEAEVSPAILKSLAILYRSFQRHIILLKGTLQAWLCLSLSAGQFQDHHGPVWKPPRIGECPVGRGININIMIKLGTGRLPSHTGVIPKPQ